MSSAVHALVEHLREVVRPPEDTAGFTDAQLLTCFIERRDPAAIEALLRRHGSMVMGVCRRLLRNPHDADDAFQATFLVLLQKARSVAPRKLVANWLYGVARTTALRMNAIIARRRAREKQVHKMPEPEVAREDSPTELLSFLDHELSRLPEKYRIPIILCDLAGKSHKDAARQLGWPQGTLSARLSRGRRMLANRLARHAPAPAGSALAAVLSRSASASVPPQLVSTIIKAASVLLAQAGRARGGSFAQGCRSHGRSDEDNVTHQAQDDHVGAGNRSYCRRRGPVLPRRLLRTGCAGAERKRLALCSSPGECSAASAGRSR